MEESKEEDIKTKYPSLPPTYVSLAQLKERWIQQQKQKEQEQKQKEKEKEKEEIALANQQLKFKEEENKGFKRNGFQSNRKNGGEGRIRIVTRGGDHREFWVAKGKREVKSEKLEVPAFGDEGGGKGKGIEKYRKNKKYNQERREGPIQTLSEIGGISGGLIGGNGGKKGYERSGYEKERVEETVSVYMGVVPEIEAKNPVGSSRKSRGKEVVIDQFLSGTENWRCEGNCHGRQVVNGRVSRRIEGKCSEKEKVHGKFLSNIDDKGIEGSGNEVNGSEEEEVSAVLRRKNGGRCKGDLERSGNHKGLVKEGTMEELQDNEVGENERRKTGKERFRRRFRGNEGKLEMKRNSNDNKVELEISQQNKESNGLKAITVGGVQGYRSRDIIGPKIMRYFGDSSEDHTRKQVVNGQFSSSIDHCRVEGKCSEKETVNGQSLSNTDDDKDIEGSGDGFMVEVLPENGSEEEKVSAVLRQKHGRRCNAEFANYKGLVGEGKVGTLEEDNEVGEDEMRKTGKERCRVSYKRGPKLTSDFGHLSLDGSRKGYSSRGQRWGYENFGTFDRPRKWKQADDGLVWVKKEEKSSTNPAEV